MAEGSDFETFWKNRFGDVLPLGYKLRETLTHRWLRIHSLPNGKRYPETPDEYAVMQARHIAIADNTLGPDQPCWLSACLIDYPDELTRDLTLSAATELGLQDTLNRRCYAESENEQVPVRIFANLVAWDATIYTKWLPKIANDGLRLIWTSSTTAAVYAPYDGGVDLILPTREDRVTIEKRFQSWRSDREDGL